MYVSKHTQKVHLHTSSWLQFILAGGHFMEENTVRYLGQLATE